ncbi:DUF2550 domain-containing protein [Litorihabitans aurantiacus]|uniref:DUF2550 family protein n=1 Tax=Litorihabitans aurantiacus TaxID=1930061 RepID=A0AA37UKD8_9MICO|nr:DUF2550 domain-containing protein [Litorihabitans aurantiacus]GMA30700.1 hypothetical protein GCM10025875_06920 [Litorihabitans aurantiacus]
MPGVVWIALVVVVGLVLALAGVFFLRLRTLGHRVGSFECALRTPTGWASGIAHYGADSLHWYRLISLDPRPDHSWSRARFHVRSRDARDPSAAVTPSRIFEVSCEVDGREFVLAMRSGQYSGLSSWLESQPPREMSL